MEWMLLPYRRLYRLIEGRSSRREFWMFTLLNFLIVAVVVGVFAAIGGLASLRSESLNPESIGLGLLGATAGLVLVLIVPLYIWALLTSVAAFAVTVRRFHDLNLSGWFYAGSLVLMFIPLLNLVVWLGLVALMCIPGTKGPNKYGDDPAQPIGPALFE